MRVIAEAEGIGLEVFIDDDVPALMVDAVKVESVAGGGNTFHVRLPRHAFWLRTVKATSRT